MSRLLDTLLSGSCGALFPLNILFSSSAASKVPFLQYMAPPLINAVFNSNMQFLKLKSDLTLYIAPPILLLLSLNSVSFILHGDIYLKITFKNKLITFNYSYFKSDSATIPIITRNSILLKCAIHNNGLVGISLEEDGTSTTTSSMIIFEMTVLNMYILAILHHHN